MPARLRAFISSTMEDLGNERRAVAARLQAMNIDPVHAEELPPDGSSSWDLIEEEIKSCQLFILVSGRSYGWIPTKGPGAGGKHSVTHLEALEAQRQGKIILPFFMDLKHGEPVTEQTQARDAFRREIDSWEAGRFRQTFSWADELADRVADSVAAVLGQALRRELQAKSAQASVQRRVRVERFSPETDVHGTIARAAWVSRDSVLLAGAGMSIAAGFPSSPALAQTLLREMGPGAPGADTLPGGHGFSDVAELFEAQFDRKTLIDRVSASLLGTDAFGPTHAHLAAVKIFRTIATTNMDLLFEAACELAGLPYIVVTSSDPPTPLEIRGGPVICKIDGTIEKPGSLVLTRRDVEEVGSRAAWLWDAMRQRLLDNSLIVIGHALRNPVSKILPEAGVHVGGAYVTPFLSEAETDLLARYRLTGVKADADSFMIAFEQAIANRDK